MGEYSENIELELPKENLPLTALGDTSFVLFSILKFRISFSKIKVPVVISSFGTKSLFSFTAIGFGIFMITFIYLITRIVNKMAVNVNYNHWLYLLFLLMPQFVIASIIITYYVQYSKLKTKFG